MRRTALALTIATAALGCVLVAACSPDSVSSPPAAERASAGPGTEGLHLLGRLVTGRRRGFVPMAETASGLMICLEHEAVRGVPRHLRTDAVVGCDRRFANGEIAPIDYTPQNAPEFAEFVQPIVEGRDALIMSWIALPSERWLRGRRQLGGLGNWASIIFMGLGPRNDDAPPRRVDLRGHTIRLMRLRGSVDLTPAPDGYVYAFDLVWEFYGAADASPESAEAARFEAAILDAPGPPEPSAAHQLTMMRQRLEMLSEQLSLAQRKLAEARASEDGDTTAVLHMLRQLTAVRRWTESEVDSLQRTVAPRGP